MRSANTISLKPLTREAFAPFGDVIETNGAENFKINNGTTTRFHDLAKVEATGTDARVLINIFRGDEFRVPVTITMMERHPHGSQAFMPLQANRFVVVVAEDEAGKPAAPVGFLAQPGQGVNYARNTWHHPLISLDGASDFLVVDRHGKENNLEEYFFDDAFVIETL